MWVISPSPRVKQHAAFMLPRCLGGGAWDSGEVTRLVWDVGVVCAVTRVSWCISGTCNNQRQHLQVKDQIVESFLWYAVVQPHCGRRRGKLRFHCCPGTTWPAADEDGVFLLQICTCAEICSSNLNTVHFTCGPVETDFTSNCRRFIHYSENTSRTLHV